MDLLPSVKSNATEVRTPPRPADSRRDNIFLSFDESTAHVNTIEGRAEEQFDLVASKVNETIREINVVYSEIGYSRADTSSKKNEIFEAISQTISTFNQNVQREKTGIQNECDWLRQQIHLIYSILDEDRGRKVLNLSDRWLLFRDDPQLQKDIAFENSRWLLKRDSNHSLKHSSANQFSFSSLFLNGSSKDQTLLKPWAEPQFSLLQTKSRLNLLFLDALKTFVRIFQKFNELNVAFWENIDTIMEDWHPDPNDTFLSSIPTKAEAYSQSQLIKAFYSMLEDLNIDLLLNHKQNIPNEKNDDYAFIISSPTKRGPKTQESRNFSGSTLSYDDKMSRLRDINYSIVRTIRGLKISRFNHEVLTKMHKAVENTESEIRTRAAHIREKLSLCLALTESLSLSKDDVITILREPGLANSDINQLVSREGQIEVETLHFILENPHELGLKDQHINFICKLLNTLQVIKTSKELRLQTLKLDCLRLWETLNESKEFIDGFIAENDNLTDEAIANFESELKRLQEKRREFIEDFIVSTREEIEKLHVKLYHTTSQRHAFKYFSLDMDFVTDDKEKILSEHETELDCLRSEFNSKRKILELYLDLKDLVADQKFLEDSSKNSKRLLEKNSCQTLLNEERIRKRLQKSLPRVLTTIKREILAFNDDLISKGGKAINIGEGDLFEEILMIEAGLNHLNANKTSRIRSSKENPRSASPTKTRQMARSISPVKPKSSPQKVTKYSNSRIALSPTKLDKLKNFSSRYPGTLASSSGIPKLSHRETESTVTFKTGNFGSPTLRDSFNLQSSPRQVSSSSQSSNQSSSSSGTLRMPSSHFIQLNSLQSSDNIIPQGMFFDRRESSALYSTCSRLSPLRGDSLSNIRQNPVLKKAPFHFEPDKENQFEGGFVAEENSSLSPVRYNESFKNVDALISRLSTNSLANSTILGDDYQTWRNERIRELNRNN